MEVFSRCVSLYLLLGVFACIQSARGRGIQANATQSTCDQKLERINVELTYSNTETVTRLQSMLQELSARLDEQSVVLAEHSTRLGTQPSAIGFSAYATANQSPSYPGAVVMFPGIVSNFGGHYDPSSSKFTCPQDGTYVFHLSIHTPVGKEMWVALVREGNRIARAVADDEAGDRHYSHASAAVVTECMAAEQVWVLSTCASSNCELYGSSHRYTMFSGFILHAYN